MTVVRLKGGDPYIFGRGGEEALALKEAELPFEVVPGVTSGVAAPGIRRDTRHPQERLDQRRVRHGARGPDERQLGRRLGKAGPTAPIRSFCTWAWAGWRRSRKSSSRLGRARETPVACVRWGTVPEQRTVTGTLEDIAERVAEAGLKPPAIIVVGDVVALREEGLDWYERRPLFGRRVVVTRARAQAGELSADLEKLGAEVHEFPTIEISPPEDFGPLDAAIRDLDSFGLIVFTSVNGVEAFLKRLQHHGLDLRAVPRDAKVAAIGPATAERIEWGRVAGRRGPRRVQGRGPDRSSRTGSLAGERVLIPRAKVAREILPEKLREAGAEVVVPPAYESVPLLEGQEEVSLRLQSGEIDCVTFTASSTVENFVGAFGAEEAARLLAQTRVACIGPITADTARKHGLRVDAEAKEYTIPGLIEAVTGLLAADPAKRGE